MWYTWDIEVVFKLYNGHIVEIFMFYTTIVTDNHCVLKFRRYSLRNKRANRDKYNSVL